MVPENMVLVEGGSFSMGGANATPAHTVQVNSFFMGQREVSQKEYAAIMGGNRSSFKGDNLPVEMVSWFDAIEYCIKLSQKEGLTPAYRGNRENIICDFTATGYRLPTEAEWEYAAKGGSKDWFTYDYSGGNQIEIFVWYKGNSGNKTHPTGEKIANSLGIYDMSGNVWEWCWDWSGNYTAENQNNPRGAVSGARRVLRGGSWNFDAQYQLSSTRNSASPSDTYNYVGFRVVRTVS
jgi:formylglycine-generating enzyme required for sulfatase activity